MATKVQNHIHLARAVDGTPPVYKWRTVADEYNQKQELIITANRSLNGKLQVQFLPDTIDATRPIKFDNYELTVIVRAEENMTVDQRLDLLKGMNGEKCYFVPHYHPDTNESHVAYVKTVLLQFEDIPPFNPGLTRYQIPVKLLDWKL